MKYYIGLCAAILASTSLGQAPQPQQPPPQLSDPIQLQLKALAQELNQVQRDFITVDSQVRKDYPGWHLSQQLQLEKDAPPAKQALPVPPPAPAKK